MKIKRIIHLYDTIKLLCFIRERFETKIGVAIMDYTLRYPYVLFLEDNNMKDDLSFNNKKLEETVLKLKSTIIIGWNKKVAFNHIVEDFLEYDKKEDFEKKKKQFFTIYNYNNGNTIHNDTITHYINMLSLKDIETIVCSKDNKTNPICNLFLNVCYSVYRKVLYY